MIIPYRGHTPKIAPTAFVAPTAVVIGNVTIEEGASVWYGVVLRGDVGEIVVRAGANVQDNTVVHCIEETPTLIGPDVTVGHMAFLEGCRVERGAVIGIQAVLLNHVLVGEEAMVAAGAVVPEGMSIPSRHLAAGVPAVVKKEISEASLKWVQVSAQDYQRLCRSYLEQGLGDVTLRVRPRRLSPSRRTAVRGKRPALKRTRR